MVREWRVAFQDDDMGSCYRSVNRLAIRVMVRSDSAGLEPLSGISGPLTARHLGGCIISRRQETVPAIIPSQELQRAHFPL